MSTCVVKPVPKPEGVSRYYTQNVFGFRMVCDGYDEVGWIFGAVVHEGRKRRVRVTHVEVDSAYQRHGYATRLYEALAQAACRKRMKLVSDERTAGAHSHDFWGKQLQKGRAKVVGENKYGPIFELSCAHASDLSGLRKKKAAKSRRRK